MGYRPQIIIRRSHGFHVPLDFVDIGWRAGISKLLDGQSRRPTEFSPHEGTDSRTAPEPHAVLLRTMISHDRKRMAQFFENSVFSIYMGSNGSWTGIFWGSVPLIGHKARRARWSGPGANGPAFPPGTKAMVPAFFAVWPVGPAGALPLGPLCSRMTATTTISHRQTRA
jgi:hypothetical protein